MQEHDRIKSLLEILTTGKTIRDVGASVAVLGYAIKCDGACHSQRQLARMMGTSLGAANSIIRRVMREIRRKANRV